MRLLASTILALIATAALALGGAAQESDSAGSPSVLSPGPLGRSYADWAGDWVALYAPIGNDDPANCQLGDLGEVFFLLPVPDPGSRCQVSADAHVLAGSVAFGCRLLDRNPDPEAYVACVDGYRITDPYLVVDGTELDVDETFVTLSRRVDGKVATPRGLFDGRVRAPSFFVMLEPLAPGNHTIEWGYMLGQGPGELQPYTERHQIEVVAE